MAAFPRLRIKAQAGQQRGEHLVVVGHGAAQKRSDANAVAATAREAPAEAVFDQAKFKPCRLRFIHRPLHLQGQGRGQTRLGISHPQLVHQITAGAMGQHQRSRLETRLAQAQFPSIAMAADLSDRLALQAFRTSRGGLIGQVAIKHITAHDPKR